MLQFTNLSAKIKESLESVLPVSIIVLILCFSCAGVDSGVFLTFLIGAVFLIVGMGLFNIGVDSSMNFMGEYVGAQITKSRKLPMVVLVSLFVGVMITVSEPDLQVLADQIAVISDGAIASWIIIWSVGIGTGVFLVIAMLRIIFGIRLKYLLLICYGLVFLLSVFVPADFWAMAFDSGGVTTGPMTVPFVMALGVGVSSIRSDSQEEQDSFGLISLCSVGPIISVLILGLIFRIEGGEYTQPMAFDWARTTTSIGSHYLESVPQYIFEVLKSIAPIYLFFMIFQLFTARITKSQFFKVTIGVFTTVIGLILFLTGANVGFMPLGHILGTLLAEGEITTYLIIPIGMLIGFFIVRAEPAVHILTHQVSDITSGAVSPSSILNTLCVSVSLSVGLSFLRIITGISIMYFLIPGYILAFLLTFIVPDIFVSIAFDSGGVASGPMTATFMLSLAIGVCSQRGGNIVTDAFGTVAMVAMTPLIAIQVFGLIYKLRSAKSAKEPEFVPIREEIINL